VASLQSKLTETTPADPRAAQQIAQIGAQQGALEKALAEQQVRLDKLAIERVQKQSEVGTFTSVFPIFSAFLAHGDATCFWLRPSVLIPCAALCLSNTVLLFSSGQVGELRLRHDHLRQQQDHLENKVAQQMADGELITQQYVETMGK
jgi:hypothetical protein